MLYKSSQPVRLLVRLLVSTLVVSCFFVAIQDLLVFPMLWGYPLKWFANSTTPSPLTRHLVKSFDGTHIEIFEHPPTTNNVLGAAIIFHGNGLPALNFMQLQQWSASLGLRSYMVEYRGYGGTGGWPSEQTLYQDAEVAWDFVHEATALPPNKVVLLGMSIGSGPAAYLASRRNPRALVLLSAYSSLREVAHETPLLGLLTPFFRWNVPVTQYLSELEETCVISAHGDADMTIPFAHQEKLAVALTEKHDFHRIVLTNGGHNDIFPRAAPQITSALSVCLGWPDSSPAPDR
jgi:fermentation-respiration switch protein FrsA (DUF1100 family)